MNNLSQMMITASNKLYEVISGLHYSQLCIGDKKSFEESFSNVLSKAREAMEEINSVYYTFDFENY